MPTPVSNLVKPRPGLVGMSTPNGVKYVDVGGSQAIAHPSAYVPTNPVGTSGVATNPLGSAPVKGLLSSGGSSVSPNINQPPQNTFSGLVGSLAQTAQQGSPTAQHYNEAGFQAGQGSIPVANQARDIAEQFGQKYADIGQAGAKFQAGQLTTGTTPVAEGNAAVTAQTTAAQQAALAAGEQAALQGIGYQLTGQQQAAGAANNATGQALTGQGQTITGLNQAAGYAQPQLGSPYQIPFSPLTQGQGTPLGSESTGGLNTLAQNYGTFQGIQSGAQAAGAAAGNIQAGQAGQIAGYKSAQQQGQNLISQLNDLISTFGLNPSDINVVNAGIQKIAQNTSSPQYQILSNYLSDVAARYSQILTPPGGAATDTTRAIASSMLNATASGKSIQQVLQALDQQAQAVIAGVPATGTVPGGQSSSGSSSTSAGGYNFVLQNGKWVAQ